MRDYVGLLTSRISEGRKVMIYGAGSQGRGLVRALRSRGIEPSGFIDMNPVLHGRLLSEVRVFTPDILKEPAASSDYFVIIAAFFFEREISALLEANGFDRDISYVAYSSLKPRDYVVEVSGTCNLRCISCPRGGLRTGGRPARMMTLEEFRMVIDKILREDPFVGNVQLYQWGEPTLNKELPEMIQYAHERGILCTISSNLNHTADFAALIASRPECLRISVSGTDDDYGITHTGGSWDSFSAHVEEIARLRRDIYPTMKVELYYHLYKHSLGPQQDRIAEMCRNFDFEFHPVPAYLISLDDVLAYCEGRPFPEAAARARELLLIDTDEGLARARSEAGLACDALRVVQVNSDLSVPVCMMFFDTEGNTVAGNFLDVSVDELDARRRKAQLCSRCRKFGIHRYCGVYAQMGEEKRY